jgi:nicotinate-nucleotide adenylyltransferase
LSEKRDLWVPIALAIAGLGALALDISEGRALLGAGALVLAWFAAVACLPLRMKRGQRAVLSFGAGMALLLVAFLPPVALRVPDALVWVLAAAGFLLPVRPSGAALRGGLLGAAGLMALLGVLALAGPLPRRAVPLLLAGAFTFAVLAWRTRPRREAPVVLGPRICVFGGTFDPFHRGHRALCEAALKSNERLLVVVAGNPPHKEAPDSDAPVERTDFHHRVAMARLGVEGLPRTEVLELEGRRPGPSYTVETLDLIRKSHPPEARFRLLLGADMYQSFPTWHDWEGILERITLLVARRPGHDVEPPPEFEGRNTPVDFLDAPEIAVSSTEIRDLLREGRDVGDRVSPAVRAYIREHGLYGSAPSATT